MFYWFVRSVVSPARAGLLSLQRALLYAWLLSWPLAGTWQAVGCPKESIETTRLLEGAAPGYSRYRSEELTIVWSLQVLKWDLSSHPLYFTLPFLKHFIPHVPIATPPGVGVSAVSVSPGPALHVLRLPVLRGTRVSAGDCTGQIDGVDDSELGPS